MAVLGAVLERVWAVLVPWVAEVEAVGFDSAEMENCEVQAAEASSGFAQLVASF